LRTDISLLPDVDYPTISIQIVYPGASAQEIEENVTEPVERSIGVLEGLETMVSYSSESEVEIDLRFDLAADMEERYLEVRERLRRVRGDLPDGVERIHMRQYTSRDMPAMIVAFTSENMSTEEVRHRVENQLEPPLHQLEGTANVDIAGGREINYLVDVIPYYVDAGGLSIYNISEAIHLADEYQALTDVYHRNRLFPITQEEPIASVEDLARLPVYRTDQGRVVEIDDLGTVERGYLPLRGLSRVDGSPSVAAYVYMAGGHNVLQFTSEVEEVLAEQEIEGIESHVVFDQAEPINRAFAVLARALLIGIIGATLVLLLFFRELRFLLVVALSIPASLAVVTIVLYFSPFDLNITTISGMALGVGMLVDSAIIVAENIKRVYSETDGLAAAAVEGTAEVIAPLFAAMLTTIIVFVPLLFVQPRIRRMYSGLALVVSVALFASLIVSFFLIPVLFTLLKPARDRTHSYLRSSYRFIINHSTPLAWILASVAVIFVLLSLPLLTQIGATTDIGFEDRIISAHIEFSPGTPIERIQRDIGRMERDIAEKDYVQNFTTRFERWIGDINIQLLPLGVTTVTTDEAVRELAEIFDEYRREGIQIYFQQESPGDMERVQLELSGPSIDRLHQLGLEYVGELQDMGIFEDVQLIMPRPQPELRVDLDRRRLAEFGLSPRAALHELRAQVGGEIASEMRVEGREYDIVFRFDREMMDEVRDVERLYLTSTRTGENVPLTSVAEINRREVGSQIQRLNAERTAFLAATTRETDLASVYQQIDERLGTRELPRDYFFSLGEGYRELVLMREEMHWVVLITVFLIYLVLAGVSESLWQPFLVMLAVPVSVSGTFWMLYLSEQPFSLPVYIGLIILMGIVVNEAIVMVARISDLLSSDNTLTEAVQRGAADRLRPILMTYSTTMIAMLPVALTGAAGVALGAALAHTVIVGLTVGVIFNLFFLPAIFYGVEKLKRRALSWLVVPESVEERPGHVST